MQRTPIVGVFLLYFLNPEHLSCSTWSCSCRERSHFLKPPQEREKCSVIYITWYTNASHTCLLIDANPINTRNTHTHTQCHTLGDTEWEAAPLCVSGTQEGREQKRNEHFESKRSLGRAAGEWTVRERLGSSMRLLLTALREQLNLMAKDGPRNCSIPYVGFLFCDIKLWLN